MITTLKFKLKQNGNPLAVNSGSLMHGYIFETLPSGLAEQLHDSQVQLFSQHLLTDRDEAQWQVNFLHRTWGSQFSKSLKERIVREKGIWLRQKDTLYPADLLTEDNVSYRELAGSIFTSDCLERKLHMEFHTPAAFRSNDSYVFMPDIRLIFNSLLTRWNVCASGVSLDDPDILDHLTAHVSITSYNLRSRLYDLERSRIPGFAGTVDYIVRGPDALARIAVLLLKYSSFSGIGIKTAMGMGAVAMVERHYNY